jgi:hypothetical protein
VTQIHLSSTTHVIFSYHTRSPTNPLPLKGPKTCSTQKCLSSASIFLNTVGVGTAGKMLVSKFQICLIALPSALVAAELARHPGLEIELNLLHIAPSVPRPSLLQISADSRPHLQVTNIHLRHSRPHANLKFLNFEP